MIGQQLRVGLRASILGPAALFTVIHPVVSWLPVFGLGIVTAWTMERTRSLLPCIVVHAFYNLVVVGWLWVARNECSGPLRGRLSGA